MGMPNVTQTVSSSKFLQLLMVIFVTYVVGNQENSLFNLLFLETKLLNSYYLFRIACMTSICLGASSVFSCFRIYDQHQHYHHQS